MVMRFPEGRRKAVTLSYDDGVVQDAHLVNILDKYGLKATFNLNSGPMAEAEERENGRLNVIQAKELYGSTHHEVAIHTVWHPSLVDLSPQEVQWQVAEDQRALERIFGKPIRGMAYPFGTYNEAVVDSLKQMGIAYARTANSTGTFTLPDNWLQWTATCHHGDTRLWELVDQFLDDSSEDNTDSPPLLFYLWGHSYEFDDQKNWDVLETFCRKMGKRSDIWYATNLEIYEYVQAFRKLRVDTKAGRIHNPSACKLWLECDGKGIVVNAGDTIDLHA